MSTGQTRISQFSSRYHICRGEKRLDSGFFFFFLVNLGTLENKVTYHKITSLFSLSNLFISMILPTKYGIFYAKMQS